MIYLCCCFYSSCALFLDFGFVMMYLLCVLFVGIIFVYFIFRCLILLSFVFEVFLFLILFFEFDLLFHVYYCSSSLFLVL